MASLLAASQALAQSAELRAVAVEAVEASITPAESRVSAQRRVAGVDSGRSPC